MPTKNSSQAETYVLRIGWFVLRLQVTRCQEEGVEPVRDPVPSYARDEDVREPQPSLPTALEATPCPSSGGPP